MTDRYERIRAALAMGPTPGEWYWTDAYPTQDGRKTWSLIGDGGFGILSCDGDENSPQSVNAAAAELIAACDPDTIRELLTERDQLTAALEAALEDGWQPIETAPNGTWLLVHSERGWIGLARRSDPDYAPDEGWFEDEHTEFLDPAWLTHWRPLPAPPAIDRARRRGGKEAGND